MSKYNLSELLNEIAGTGRIGTYIDSYRGLIDKIEDIKSKGIAVKELGMSGDGKVPFEFEIYPGDKDEAFSVYPYKFDPSESDPMEIHRFSIGGKPVAIRVAKELLGQEAMSNAEVRDGLQGLKDAGDDISDFSDLQEGDLFSSKFDRQELKAIINDLNEEPIFDMAVRRAYKFLVSLLDNEDKVEMGLNENKEKDLINAMRFHLLQHQKGIIDKDDVINAMEELAFGRVKAPGMEESVKENLVDEDDVRYFDFHFGDKYSEDFIVDYIKSGNFEAALDEHPLEDEHKDFWAYELAQFDADRDDVSLQEHFSRFMKDYQ